MATNVPFAYDESHKLELELELEPLPCAHARPTTMTQACHRASSYEARVRNRCPSELAIADAAVC